MHNRIITVIVADDHPHEVSGIIDLLGFAEGIKVIGQASSAQQAVRLAIDNQPDVILLDLVWNKSKEEGLTAIRQIKEGAPQTRILAMSAYDEMLEPARRSGADKVIHKDFLSSKLALVDRIRDAYEVGLLPKPEATPVETLTPREKDILRLMCEGKSDKEIARHWNLAYPTVKKYAQSIYGKLGVSNRTEATAYVFRHGMQFLENGTQTK